MEEVNNAVSGALVSLFVKVIAMGACLLALQVIVRLVPSKLRPLAHIVSVVVLGLVIIRIVRADL